MSLRTVRFLRVKDVPNLEIYRATEVAAFAPRHVHGVFSLSVVEAGVRIHETKQAKCYTTPGSIVIVNLGEMHSNSTPNGYKCSTKSIRIDPQLLSRLFTQIIGRHHDTVQLRLPVIYDPDLSRRILNLCKVLSNSASKIEKECFVLDIFTKLCERHSREGITSIPMGDERAPVARVCEYLQDCSNENVSLDKLAAIAGLSPFHLSRVFTKETGVPPHAYQLQIRLKIATDLLALGRPLAQVASETGFCDQSHFQRAFKKKFGITPGQYEW